LNKKTWRRITIGVISSVMIIVTVLIGRRMGWSARPYLENLTSQKRVNLDVEVTLVANIDSKLLRMKFYICCKDEDQQAEALCKVPRIQDELVDRVKDYELVRSVATHDLESVRRHLMEVVNRKLTFTAEEVYFDRFFFN